MFLQFLKQNWMYIVYVCQAVVLICVTIIYSVKNRRLKLLEIAERAVEAAEQIDGTGEQRKTYAVALIKQELRVSDRKISDVIENLIEFSKKVNSKSNKTIQEVLCDEFKTRDK